MPPPQHAPPPTVLVYAPRERARSLVRSAFPRRRARVIVARAPSEFDAAVRRALVDAALIDMGSATEDAWHIAGRALDYSTVPFFAVLPTRLSDGPTVARCAALHFADILTEQLDDDVARALVLPHTFTARFALALHEPPPALGLDSRTQRAVWTALVRYGGRPVTSSVLARVMGVSREHLSRSFARGSAPNLKRVTDLVRLIAAAELAKNTGYDVRDLATVLGFASSSHLAVTAKRVVGIRPASLSGLRAVELVDRFVQGRARSRG